MHLIVCGGDPERRDDADQIEAADRVAFLASTDGIGKNPTAATIAPAAPIPSVVVSSNQLGARSL